MLNIIKKYQVLFITLLVISSCVSKSEEESELNIYKPPVTDAIVNNNNNNNNISQIKGTYLALGDSYTIGQSVTADMSFPYILVDKLNKQKIAFEPPKVIARTGWTTNSLKNAISKENIEENFDLVTLLIGVNNQFQGGSIDVFRTEFTELLEMAILFAGNNPKNVIVISIPDWGASPYALNFDRSNISQEINSFNAVKKQITLGKQVIFVNVTDITRQVQGNDVYFASDRLHFSGLMHLLWVDEILKFNF